MALLLPNLVLLEGGCYEDFGHAIGWKGTIYFGGVLYLMVWDLVMAPTTQTRPPSSLGL